MFWCGVMIGVVIACVLVSIVIRAQLIRCNMSVEDHGDVMRIISNANGKRPIVVEVWEERNDNSGNAELIGQVTLERK